MIAFISKYSAVEKSIMQILNQVILRRLFQFFFANTRPNVFGFSIDVCESRGFFSVIKTSSVITAFYILCLESNRV